MYPGDLTNSQCAAVTHRDGPLLVLAGPGSGKTRVITRRIAHLVESGVPPSQILAITFTNKAAGEVQERIERLLPGTFIWATTFHKFCARVLRQYGEAVGVRSNFSILDAGDQRQAIKHVMRDLGIDPVHYTPERVAYRISNAKNDMLTAESFRDQYAQRRGNYWDAIIAQVYPDYQKWLFEANSLDFDDLLLHTAVMLQENPELRKTLDARYRYILVDEFQDTNAAQYGIVAALSKDYPNLCVTGDPDQSIYGWRGARIENILKFERDFPRAKVIRLEQNFRSTGAILRSADALIANNLKRKVKRLITDNPEGEPVRLLCYDDAAAEARGIAGIVRELVGTGEFDWGDIAIFYRVNALSRQLEEAFRRERIPFQLASGFSFYERAEVKDLLSYLRLVHNPADRAAFLRVVNTPLRGLGETSQRRLVRWADSAKLTLLEAAARASDVPELSARAAKGFKAFAHLIEEFSLADSGSVAALLEHIIDGTGYRRGLLGSASEKDRDRLANIDELVASANQYDEEAGNEPTLEGFLEAAALVNETDRLESTSGRVTMMTLHAAKGLEYAAAFIVGVEDGLIPHERAKRDQDGNTLREVEEERRLLFVGMTRAKQRLFLTQCSVRAIHGRNLPTIVSPFLREFEFEAVDLQGSGELLEPDWPEDMMEIDVSADRDETADEKAIVLPKLMSGADLLNGTRLGIEVPHAYTVGMQVRHPRYGLGTVTRIGFVGARRTVTVQFDEEERIQNFIASKAPLQPVGGR